MSIISETSLCFRICLNEITLRISHLILTLTLFEKHLRLTKFTYLCKGYQLCKIFYYRIRFLQSVFVDVKLSYNKVKIIYSWSVSPPYTLIFKRLLNSYTYNIVGMRSRFLFYMIISNFYWQLRRTYILTILK